MSDTVMKKFMVFFCIPLATMTDWQKIEPRQREAAEKDMMQRWQKWSADHADMILSSEAGGRTKNVSAASVTDTRNDIVVSSIVQAESHDAVAALYQSHPHLGIPSATIQIMELKPMGGM